MKLEIDTVSLGPNLFKGFAVETVNALVTKATVGRTYLIVYIQYFALSVSGCQVGAFSLHRVGRIQINAWIAI